MVGTNVSTKVDTYRTGGRIGTALVGANLGWHDCVDQGRHLPNRGAHRHCSGGCQPWLARMCRPRSTPTEPGGHLGIALVGANLGWHDCVDQGRHLPKRGAHRHCFGGCQPWLARMCRPRSTPTEPGGRIGIALVGANLGWHDCVDQGRHLPKRGRIGIALVGANLGWHDCVDQGRHLPNRGRIGIALVGANLGWHECVDQVRHLPKRGRIGIALVGANLGWHECVDQGRHLPNRGAHRHCPGGCQPWLARLCRPRSTPAKAGAHRHCSDGCQPWLARLCRPRSTPTEPGGHLGIALVGANLGWHEGVSRPWQHRVDQGRLLAKGAVTRAEPVHRSDCCPVYRAAGGTPATPG